MQIKEDPPIELPTHIAALIANIIEVYRLLEIHRLVGGSGSGRRHRIEVLNRSAVVLLVACWESFIEDLAEGAFNTLLDQAKKPDVFPRRVLALSIKPFHEKNDKLVYWKLAAEGWRSVLEKHRSEVINEFIGKLNTPRPKQIDMLFDKLIGLKSLSSTFKWRGMSSSRVKTKLNALVTRRGDIAHRVTEGPSVRKTYVVDCLNLIHRLSAVASNQVRSFLMKRTKTEPWLAVRWGGLSPP